MTRSVTFWIQVAGAVVFIVLAGILWGLAGAAGAAFGCVAVVLFFGSTVAIIGPIATWYPALSLPFALLFYLTKAMVLAAMFYVFATRDQLTEILDVRAISLTLIGSSILWLVGHTIDVVRRRIPTYALPESPPSDPDSVS